MSQEPAELPHSKPRWQFRLWHLVVLVAILAPILALAREPEALGVFVILAVVFGPAFGLASFFRWRIHKSARAMGSEVDAMDEFISTFFGTLIAMGFYWIVLFGLLLSISD